VGNRLSKIYTRTGDKGTTGLADGSRIKKDAPRVETMGEIDELNCLVGKILLDAELDPEVVAALTDIQHALFDIGGELAIPGHIVVGDSYVDSLERMLDRWNNDLPPLKEFILPGGGETAVACHLARTVCRRAERAIVRLSSNENVNSAAARYLNRLSDLLFVLARVFARQGSGEVYWQKGRNRT